MVKPFFLSSGDLCLLSILKLHSSFYGVSFLLVVHRVLVKKVVQRVYVISFLFKAASKTRLP